MGNSSANKDQSEVKQDMEILIKHPRLEKATLKKTENHEYLSTVLPIANSKDYDSWVHDLKESPAAHSTYALNPLKHAYKKAGMCGNSGTAMIDYENHPFLLADEIKERAKVSPVKKFTEPELWYLLYGLTDVTAKFHEKGEKAGDIRPENIFLSESGNYKIATKHSWPAELSSYEKRMFEDVKAYVAPEEANDIIVGRQNAQGSPPIAESFSVGLTILHTALLSNGDQLYADKSKLNSAILEADRDALRNEPHFSDLFKFVVLSLTDPAPENRVSCQELNTWLKANEENILKMQPFGVNTLPLKVEAYAKAPKKAPQLLDPNPSLIGELKGEPSNFNPEQANLSWQDIDEKIRKSQQMFPS